MLGLHQEDFEILSKHMREYIPVMLENFEVKYGDIKSSISSFHNKKYSEREAIDMGFDTYEFKFGHLQNTHLTTANFSFKLREAKFDRMNFPVLDYKVISLQLGIQFKLSAKEYEGTWIIDIG